MSWHLVPSDTSMLKLIRYTCRLSLLSYQDHLVVISCIGEHLVCMIIAEGYIRGEENTRKAKTKPKRNLIIAKKYL